jgi:hypothetical protein
MLPFTHSLLSYKIVHLKWSINLNRRCQQDIFSVLAWIQDTFGLLYYQICKSVLQTTFCVDIICNLIVVYCGYYRPQNCLQLSESSLHLSAHKWVSCSSRLSPWASQVQCDACWDPCVATLWPHKLSFTVTSWSYSAWGHIYSSGWRDKVSHETNLGKHTASEWMLNYYDPLTHKCSGTGYAVVAKTFCINLITHETALLKTCCQSYLVWLLHLLNTYMNCMHLTLAFKKQPYQKLYRFCRNCLTGSVSSLAGEGSVKSLNKVAEVVMHMT